MYNIYIGIYRLLNFGKWRNTASMISKGTFFGDKILSPGEGTKEAAGEINFKISIENVGLVMHRWKRLFKVMNFI